MCIQLIYYIIMHSMNMGAIDAYRPIAESINVLK